jgi:DNA-directed RNA polymerase specialized sigma24 family protein
MEELAKNLKDIAKIRREIKGLELMIHSNRKTMATDVVSGSSDEFPYSVRHFRIEGVDQSKESALQVKLRHKKKKLERELLKVEKYLDQIEDPEIRQIVRLRDELGMSWNDVAAKCGSTIAAVKMKHKRFLDKIF